MKIHHIGYLVKHFDQALESFQKLGFRSRGNSVLDESRQIMIRFLSKDEYVIELVSPVSRDSVVGSLLKEYGASPYHICYESDCFEKDISNLEKDGFLRITGPTPAPATDGCRVVFLVSPTIGLIEIVEKRTNC